MFSCVFVGACIVEGNLRDGFKDSLAVYIFGALYDEDHVNVVLFTLFLSGMVGMMEKSGGMIGFTKFVSKYAKTQRSGQYAVYLTGCMIFFDDYANCLLAGETMKPLTDLLMISREKLAFIVDATAAPIASISPVSSWVGFEIGLIVKEVAKLEERFGVGNLTITTSGLGIFLQSVKYRYYPIFMMFLLFCLIGAKRDYGPMLIAERKVTIFRRTDGGDGRGSNQSLGEKKVNQPDGSKPMYAFNMVIPVIVLVCFVPLYLFMHIHLHTYIEILNLGRDFFSFLKSQIIFIFFLLVKTGEDPSIDQSILDKIQEGDSFTALLWGTFAASIITMILYLLQWYKPDGSLAYPHYKTFCTYFCMKDSTHVRLFEEREVVNSNDAKPLISLPIVVDSFIYGMGRIFPALIVLNLAWAVGSIMVAVGADRLFARWIVGGINPESLPTLSFVISFIIALATGTSWGTMSILFPLLLVPTYVASDGNDIIFYSTVAGILSGSVAGDHVSPISDTTVLSALASDCKLLRHVTTQTPYVMVAVIISILFGTLPIGPEVWPNIIGILLGCLALAMFVFLVCVPVASPIGRYDIFTELSLRYFPNPELLELREDTKKFYSGEVLHVKEVGMEKDEPIDDNEDDIDKSETKKISEEDIAAPEEADKYNQASEHLA